MGKRGRPTKYRDLNHIYTAPLYPGVMSELRRIAEVNKQTLAEQIRDAIWEFITFLDRGYFVNWSHPEYSSHYRSEDGLVSVQTLFPTDMHSRMKSTPKKPMIWVYRYALEWFVDHYNDGMILYSYALSLSLIHI